MTKTLSLDEMLDVIHMIGLSEQPYAGELEAIGDRMAATIAEKLKVHCGPTRREESAFAGTCATFFPATKGQPCPEPLDIYDPTEWEDEDESDAPQVA